jgi:hypothetical protein
MHRHEVGVLDRRGEPRLEREARAQSRIPRPVGGDHLDRHGATEVELRRAIHDAHAAAAGHLLDAAAGDLAARRELLRWVRVGDRRQGVRSWHSGERSRTGGGHRHPALPRRFSGERVVVVADGGTRVLGDALRDAAAAAGAEAVLGLMDSRDEHGQEPPDAIVAALGQADVFIAPTRSRSRTRAPARPPPTTARAARRFRVSRRTCSPG